MNEFYCPLVGLKLNSKIKDINDELMITEKVKIVSQKQVPDLELIKNHIAIEDINKYKLIPYWLLINGNFTNYELETKIIFFQLALWMLIPTATVIPFMTDFKEMFMTLHQRFIPNSRQINNVCELSELKNIGNYISRIDYVYLNHKRVNLALLYTFDSCLIQNWDSIFILMVTAFESILNHKAHISESLQKKLRWGITKKLSWAYAILSENNDKNRISAFIEFKHIYEIRSDLVHGKTFKDKYNDGKLNLKELAKCRDMLRKLWQVILDSEEIIENLSGDDRIRRKYFKNVANGWMPEEDNGKKE